MGEMADYYINQSLDAGFWFHSPREPRPKPVCGFCGSHDVHWRIFAGDYKLADDQRQHPGNRYVQHVCPTTADGFGDTDD